jgi:uncharacterized membrane protein YgdD (TMEM256/DUF423 family)
MVKVLAILIGIVLVVVGSVVVTYDGITLTARQQQVLSVGPLQASTESAQRTIPLPTVVGGAVVVAGIVMVFVGAFMKRRPKQTPTLPPAEST